MDYISCSNTATSIIDALVVNVRSSHSSGQLKSLIKLVQLKFGFHGTSTRTTTTGFFAENIRGPIC